MPDAELSSLAERGKLHEPEVLKAQAKRMLNHPRSRALFDGFGAQWLGLGDLESKTFDPAKFPQMTSALRAAMYDEARLFFENVVRENRSILSFVDSDYTFLNGTIAPLYGLDKKVTGPKWRKVKLADSNRGGILGMPGVLAVTSFPDRTSPVKRGVWVLEQILGEDIPPPPPNIPTLEKQDKQTIENLTLRQRTELHVKDPTCANCHKVLDPIGFGLENFDAIGRWRNQDDAGAPSMPPANSPAGKLHLPKEFKSLSPPKRKTSPPTSPKNSSPTPYAPIQRYKKISPIIAENLPKKGFRCELPFGNLEPFFFFTCRAETKPNLFKKKNPKNPRGSESSQLRITKI